MKNKTSINMKLGFGFLIALLIPTLLIAFISYNSAKNEIGKKINESASQSVQTVDAYINRHVGPIVNDVDYFSSLITVNERAKNRSKP